MPNKMDKMSLASVAQTIVFLLFILSLGALSISNYTVNNLILKITLIVVYCLTSLINIKLQNYKFLDIIRHDYFLKTGLILFIFAFMTGITVFYSENLLYGLVKWINLLFTIIPFILITLTNVITWKAHLVKGSIFTTMFFTAAASVVIIGAHPFD